ncbi:tyrosine-type recombinase/integrase [Aestuariibaculum sp. M13]|uniref:site-specific integrase n=1 Tax=Aestuariibaculum sp. M13 TaxID=2967132 RepID=UPI00280A7F00|nr:tyrosine-type recombinase/integrase [Aestuariibaculum sp. M13]
MKINILFYLSKKQVNASGRCPVKCRLTYDKQRKEFSTGQFVNPKNWDSKQQVVKPPEPDVDYINSQLSLIKTKINRAFLLLQVKEEAFAVVDVYSLYKGVKRAKEYNIVEYFERYLKRLKTLVGVEIKQVTYEKFEYIKSDIKAFIKWKYKTKDYPLKKLDMNFLTELDYYYKVGHKTQLKQVTINKKIQRFRKIIKVAVAERHLDLDPFMLYRAKKVKKVVVFLSPEELVLLEGYEFRQPRLKLAKDLFIFSCYTGLPYLELMNLKAANIVGGFDGNKWIKIKREKTSKDLSIPLLPKALKILDKYAGNEFVFPRISNQRYNSYLKEIASIVGVDKNLTTHMARRTFASTVLLYNNVPMEIVSELLGHSDLKVTQESYGKVVQRKISDEIGRLKKESL